MATKAKTPDTPAEDAPEASAPTVTEAEYWAKNGRFRIGDIAKFEPFVVGFNNMGKLVDAPNKISIGRAEDKTEHLLYRGKLVTRDPDLIGFLDKRIEMGGQPIRLHAKRQVNP